MYTMGDIIYGVPLTSEVMEAMPDWQEDDEEELCGFYQIYSGRSKSPVGYCGVLLDSIDELAVVNINSLKLVPTQEQKEEAETKVEALLPEIKKVMLPIGTYIVWSTS